MLPIIDTHQHLWDLTRLPPPWIKEGHPLHKSFLPEDYAAAVKGTGIEKAIYVEVAMAAEQKQAEAEWVSKMCERGDTLTRAAVVGGRPEDESFAKYARQFKGSKYVKGIRRTLHGGDAPRELCLRHTFIDNMHLLGELGLRFDLCLRAAELADGAKLATECPDTQFILDHSGNPTPGMAAAAFDKWRQGLAALAKCENVACKISGFVANGNKAEATAENVADIVNAVYEEFGPRRVMFGSDWPVVTKAMPLAEWVALLKSVVKARSDEEQRWLFAENAVRIYGLAKED